MYGFLLKGPRGSKGDTEGPRVTLPNHSVALQPDTRAVLYFCGGGGVGGVIQRRGRGGRRGGEEVSRPTTTDDHRQHSECKPPSLHQEKQRTSDRSGKRRAETNLPLNVRFKKRVLDFPLGPSTAVRHRERSPTASGPGRAKGPTLEKARARR